jgi:hypothetical protein
VLSVNDALLTTSRSLPLLSLRARDFVLLRYKSTRLAAAWCSLLRLMRKRASRDVANVMSGLVVIAANNSDLILR